MPANAQLVEKNGATPVLTDKTNGTIRFKKADNAAVDLVNPLVKPAATQFDHSFEKWLRLNITGGSYSQITNVGAYSDGTNNMGAGVELYSKVVPAYSTPAQVTAVTGYTNFFTHNTSSRLSLGAGPFTGVGEKGDHLVMACRVTDAVSGGLTPSETLSIGWDEI